MTTKHPLLERMEKDRVFSVSKKVYGGHVEFEFREECDYYYSVELTLEEVLRLAQELIDMVTND